ncbi:MAG TPA: peptide MFS transporter [Myxococcota bacterium]|nr:peptide MFS transporter [Myxococcota bacterium]
MNAAAAELAEDRGWFGHPRGLATLYFTELWERFSYYGMRAILIFFMIAAPDTGGLGFGVPRAGLIYGTYTMSVYMLSIAGGFLGDRFLGARRAVRIATVLISSGHFVLALHGLAAFYGGLVLVALGSGLLKPNMSTLVGDLYRADDPRRDAAFSIFYMGINIGAFLGPLTTGYLAQSLGWKELITSFGFAPETSWHWGFGSAGIGMLAGLLWLRATEHRIAHVGNAPDASVPRPWGQLALVLLASAALFAFVTLADQPGLTWLRGSYVGVPALLVVAFALRGTDAAQRMAAALVFVISATLFWAAFEQGGSTIALFADRLTQRSIGGWEIPSAWFQSIGAVFVFTLAPLFAWLWVRLGERQPTSPIKFVLGLALMAASFALMVPAAELTARGLVSPWWLVGLFFVQTLGELCLSPVGLAAMTRLAPARLAGLVMGIWFLSNAFGNKVAGLLAGEFPDGNPSELAAFFETQALIVGASALALLALSPLLKRWMHGAR